MRSARRGFTLIEVMVVLLIISITVAVVSVNFGVLDRRNTADEVERLQRVLQFAAERAAVRGNPIQVEFLPGSYRFSQLDASGKWQLMFEPRELIEHDWQAGLAPGQLSVADRPVEAADARIVFTSEAPRFRLEVLTPDGIRTLTGNSAGEVLTDTAITTVGVRS
ncbi:GspH/FimT family pseudopilin [Uliginosibacterium sp. H3]|uniref:GspH/FimT family pseudopilin n=1 Tax=Uliginosibacterium silvisoli TaxID=3114758 RepID=A0ABU6K8D9_9RHOO|nr:GspH/FimT family pseudopilin [Uliginosibacterium sp. H3]